MPSVTSILQVFRYRPRLAVDLLREVLSIDAPAFDSVRAEVAPPALESDAVIVVLSRARLPVQVIAVEAPAECHSELRLRWVRLVEDLQPRFGCPTCTLVVTADLVVERWARQPIHPVPPREALIPYVLGPSNVPTDGSKSDTPMLLLMTLASQIVREA